MSSFVGSVPIGIVIVLILFSSAVLSMAAARRLPEHHLGVETKAVVSVSAAVVGTLAALVVGLLISTSNSSFMGKTDQVTQLSADVVDLDRTFRRYGPAADTLRAGLRGYAEARLEDLFPHAAGAGARLGNLATLAKLEAVQDAALQLAPATAQQRWLQGRAVQLTEAMISLGWQLGQESKSRIPAALLVMVMFWFVIIFASFGLFAPRNATAIATIFLCAVAIGGAIRMTAELQRPFQGLIRVSQTPLAQALDTIGH